MGFICNLVLGVCDFAMVWFRFFFYSLVSLIVVALAGAAVFVVLYVLPHTPRGDFVAVRIGGINVIAEVVATPAERARGLGGRDVLTDGAGMLFLFPQSGVYSFWMKDMKFPIDIIWIEDGRVVDVVERAHAFPEGTPDTFLPVYRPDASARFVLETPAGFAARHNIIIGSFVAISAQ
ncbi:MAG: DUF192 domain-containing protein [bacterium]|nr:DUF192 domain-containing protein [bacterium]